MFVPKIIGPESIGIGYNSDLETLNINDVLVETMGFLEKEALYRNIEVQYHLAEDLPCELPDGVARCAHPIRMGALREPLVGGSGLRLCRGAGPARR